MTFNFIYEIDYARLMPAIIKDARASIPEIASQNGFTIKLYTDGQVAQVDDNSIVYKIERADTGGLAGYFILNINPGTGAATVGSLILRPAFQNMVTQVSANIVTFIQSNGW